MTEQEEREKMAKEIENAIFRYKTNIRKNAKEIEKQFLKLAIEPANNIYEKFHRLRGAFDLVDVMQNCGVLSRDLCIALKKRINEIFAQNMAENDVKNGGIKKNEIYINMGR